MANHAYISPDLVPYGDQMVELPGGYDCLEDELADAAWYCEYCDREFEPGDSAPFCSEACALLVALDVRDALALVIADYAAKGDSQMAAIAAKKLTSFCLAWDKAKEIIQEAL